MKRLAWPRAFEAAADRSHEERRGAALRLGLQELQLERLEHRSVLAVREERLARVQRGRHRAQRPVILAVAMMLDDVAVRRFPEGVRHPRGERVDCYLPPAVAAAVAGLLLGFEELSSLAVVAVGDVSIEHVPDARDIRFALHDLALPRPYLLTEERLGASEGLELRG